MSFYTDKSPFWQYFKDRLDFALIAAPGALAALIHGLARYMGVVREDIYWLRDQFVPSKAEEQHIPLHGESRGVPRTRFDTNARYRTRVEKAYRWHKLGGKEQGLPLILKDYGFAGGKVINTRKENAALWAHFDLNLLQPPRDFNSEDIAAVLSLANQYKPGRSVLGKVQFAARQSAPLCAGASAQTTVIINYFVSAKEALPPGPASLLLGAAGHAYSTVEHHISR